MTSRVVFFLSLLHNRSYLCHVPYQNCKKIELHSSIDLCNLECPVWDNDGQIPGGQEVQKECTLIFHFLNGPNIQHLNSLNRDNRQFSESLPYNILRNVLRNKKVVISSLKCEDLSVYIWFVGVPTSISPNILVGRP